MRIGNGTFDGFGNGGTGSVVGSGDASLGGGTSETNLKADKVNLSNAANLVALARSESKSRRMKVDSLAELVRNGEYKADAAQLGNALIESHVKS